ncbi:MAG: arginase [Truepera sp.]|nr:arginase [Truepera sp.]HRQ10256.1 arginase [Trueperaceae bacterium]
MRKVKVLGVPMDLGAGRRGVDMGPSALRLARLAPALRELSLEVVDLGNVDTPLAEASEHLPSLAGPHHADAIAATCTTVLRTLRGLPASDFVVTLGGDHSISMGTVAGLSHGHDTGLLWVDAHADINTPATSPSGNVHGMPVAHLLGLGDERFTSMWGGGAVVRPEHVVYFGLRSVDPGERQLLAELGVTAFTMKDVDLHGVAYLASAALEQLGRLERLHVSFDADALDPSIAPGVGTPEPGGLSYREAHLLMELLADSERVTSLDLVEVNPIVDRANETAAILVEMAASLLGKRIL